MKSTADARILRCFMEDNIKRGLDFRTRPISAFNSVTEVLRPLVRLPDDVNVPQIMLEAR